MRPALEIPESVAVFEGAQEQAIVWFKRYLAYFDCCYFLHVVLDQDHRFLAKKIKEENFQLPNPSEVNLLPVVLPTPTTTSERPRR